MFDLKTQTYDIAVELQIRKELEVRTPFYIVLDKSEDVYGDDLKIWRYHLYPDKWDKELICYLEAEQFTGQFWDGENNRPTTSNWPYGVSFLKRKIWEFDRPHQLWIRPKETLEKRYYIKFNKNISDCFCQRTDRIRQFSHPSNRDGKNSRLHFYNDCYLEMALTAVVWGIDESIQMILREMDRA